MRRALAASTVPTTRQLSKGANLLRAVAFPIQTAPAGLCAGRGLAWIPPFGCVPQVPVHCTAQALLPRGLLPPAQRRQFGVRGKAPAGRGGAKAGWWSGRECVCAQPLLLGRQEQRQARGRRPGLPCACSVPRLPPPPKGLRLSPAVVERAVGHMHNVRLGRQAEQGADVGGNIQRAALPLRANVVHPARLALPGRVGRGSVACGPAACASEAPGAGRLHGWSDSSTAADKHWTIMLAAWCQAWPRRQNCPGAHPVQDKVKGLDHVVYKEVGAGAAATAVHWQLGAARSQQDELGDCGRGQAAVWAASRINLGTGGGQSGQQCGRQWLGHGALRAVECALPAAAGRRASAAAARRARWPPATASLLPGPPLGPALQGCGHVASPCALPATLVHCPAAWCTAPGLLHSLSFSGNWPVPYTLLLRVMMTGKWYDWQ